MLVREFFPDDGRFKTNHAVVWAAYKALELNVEAKSSPQVSNATLALYTRLTIRTVASVRADLQEWGYPMLPLVLPLDKLDKPKSVGREKKLEASFADANFRLDEVAVAYYLQKIPNGDVTAAFERFMNYHESKGNKFISWSAAWRTWVLNTVTFAERKTGNQPISRAYQGVEI